MANEAIFVGYRRDDTADVAGRIYDAMAQRFGKTRVFKDVDNIGPGVDFGDYIKQILPQCRVALVLIGPHWLNSKDESGRRRIDDEHDWVRVEVETALATPGLLVVPVLVNGAPMPRSEDIPDSLKPLLRRNAAIIRRDPDFHDDVERLATAIRSSVNTGIIDLSKIGGKSSGGARTPSKRKTNAPPLIGGLAAAALSLTAIGFVLPRLLPASPAQAPTQEVPPSDAPPASNLPLPQMIPIPGQSFAVSRFEVTFEQWDACVADGGCGGYRPNDQGWGRDTRPVTNVSWGDAQSYVRWLSQHTGQQYRLLTSAEWEIAARAGSTGNFSWGDANPVCDESAPNGASFQDCNEQRTRPVGSFQPNAFGLYDMHGNVYEWVEDCEDAACTVRILRSGCFDNIARGLFASRAYGQDGTTRHYYWGIRVGLTV